MKKLFITLSVMLNLAFFFIACSKMDTVAPNNGVSENRLSGRSAVVLNATYPTGVYNSLSFADAVTMINNYGANQARVINEQLGIEDARSCWFSVADIKDFIAHLEGALLQSSCLNADSLGIRFYYGAH